MKNKRQNTLSNDLITYKDLKKMGCNRYDVISKKRRILGRILQLSSLVVPDAGAGLVVGSVVLGVKPKLQMKKYKHVIKEKWRLR